MLSGFKRSLLYIVQWIAAKKSTILTFSMFKITTTQHQTKIEQPQLDYSELMRQTIILMNMMSLILIVSLQLQNYKCSSFPWTINADDCNNNHFLLSI